AAYGPNAQENSYFFARIDGYAALNQPAQTATKADQQPAANKLSGLRKVDELTFTVKLSAPFGGFRTMLGGTAFYPLPKAAFTDDGVLRDDFEQAPIGNGPFRMKGTWRRGAPIEVERYDGFAGEPPKIRGVIFKIYDRPSAEYADLTGGATDV